MAQFSFRIDQSGEAQQTRVGPRIGACHHAGIHCGFAASNP
jgi:hypothetical protein